MVTVSRARDPERIGLAARYGRDSGPRSPAKTARRPPGARARVPPDARNARQIRGVGRDGRRLCRGRGARGSVAGRHAARSRRVRRSDDGTVSRWPNRDRAVPAVWPCPGRCASRPSGPPDAAVQQRRTYRGRSVSKGAGGPGREPDAGGGGPGAASRLARRTATQGDRGRGGDGIGNGLGAAGASRWAIRLHVYTISPQASLPRRRRPFGSDGIDYRPLDIERDPVTQGFDSHSYDLMIASNVLHATRYLEESAGALSGGCSRHRVTWWRSKTCGAWVGWTLLSASWTAGGGSPTTTARTTPWLALRSGVKPSVTLVSRASKSWGWDESFTHEMLDKGVIVAQGARRR